MASMTSEKWAIIQKHFETLIDLPESEQANRLSRLKLDPDNERELRSLLEASTLTGPLDRERPEAKPIGSSGYSSLALGSSVGAFIIDRLIGRGGMGEVYAAHRDNRDFEQQVALKLLRPEFADQSDLFDRERRLLAGLQHPGIARLIDGGIAPDGRPYMAMEYIEGEPVTDWCRSRRVSLAIRLRLFEEICEAVSYAHSRLIIHRDLKPSNILVDSTGHIRLLDFGIAKLLDESGAMSATTQAMITPDYAAPEQLASEQSSVSTDVYALGAVLFELLTGRPPWRDANNALPSIIKRIFDGDPPLPSSITGETGISASALRGDLDAIILKAMRRNPGERYRSADDLADDVRRHRELKPVSAREGNRRYLTGRFLRRNTLAAALSAAALATLVVGAGGIAWQAQKTAVARDRAIAEARRLEAANKAFFGMIQDAKDKARFETTTMRQMIDGTKDRLLSSRPESPDATEIITGLAELYLAASANDEARALVTEALAKGFGRSQPADLARLKLQLSTVEIRDKQPAKARRLLDEAKTAWAHNPEKHFREILIAGEIESNILWKEGKREQAITLLKQNTTVIENANSAYDLDLVWHYHKLANYLVTQGRPKEASLVISRGLNLLNSRNEGQTNAALLLRRFEAEIASENGYDVAAVRMLTATVADRRKLFGPSLALAVDMLKLGRLHLKIGNPRAALPLLNEAAPMSTLYYGKNSDPTISNSSCPH